jgi:uncharacterized protein (TIGR00730 family)
MDSSELDQLRSRVIALVEQLPDHTNGRLIRQVLDTIVRMADEQIDRLDWKILASSLLDMERAFQAFYTHQHTRKVTIFGSARTPEDKPEYQMAAEFAHRIAQQGFMVMTGAGGGIMEAGNRGAGAEKSIGLNIRLPFEQDSNPYVRPDRLISFKYFFTRKLFLLKESDAIVAFPGGFGTQDEVFECLTLIQTGKAEPLPIVFMDYPGSDYWDAWSAYIGEHLLKRGLVNREDMHLYRITDSLEVACETIAQFYRVYHSCRYVGDRLLLRLNSELPSAVVAELNITFRDILVQGQIEAIAAGAEALGEDATNGLPCLLLHFNQRDLGRLYQLIDAINHAETLPLGDISHPELK